MRIPIEDKSLSHPARDSAALPLPPEPRLVVDGAELENLVARWRQCSAIALDTEFVRTRTYYPRLGLIQVGDPEALYLVDTVAIGELNPLVALLQSPDVVKVFHSPSEDLEVFQHFFSCIPQPLFDTQVAATLAGLGWSLGYQSLILELFGVDLPKHQQRSNWMKRPLTKAQIEYASLDVAYLLPAYEELERRISELDRASWAEEEFENLIAEGTARLDPGRIVQRLRKSSMSQRQAATLDALVRWRESEAAERDLPRNFVVRDEVLLEIVRLLPSKASELRQVRSLGSRELKRYGRTLLDRVAAGRPGNDDLAPPPLGPRPRKAKVNRLRDVVQTVAGELDLPSEMLARRRWLEELAVNVRAGRRELPEGLRGWRREVIGERLLAELTAER